MNERKRGGRERGEEKRERKRKRRVQCVLIPKVQTLVH